MAAAPKQSKYKACLNKEGGSCSSIDCTWYFISFSACSRSSSLDALKYLNQRNISHTVPVNWTLRKKEQLTLYVQGIFTYFAKPGSPTLSRSK